MNEFTALFSTISTKRELNSFLSALENASRGVFTASKDVDTFLSEQFPSHMAAALRQSAEKQGVNLADPSAATAFFQEVREALRALPVVRLRIAYTPTEAQIREITSWIRSNGGNVVLDIVYRPSLMGGAVVEYSGRVRDYSLVKRLQGFFDIAGAQSGSGGSSQS